MASRTEKLRRRQHRKDKKRRRLPGTAPEFAGSGNFVVVNRPGAVKMSEALMTLVEPEWHRCPNEEAMQKLLTMGVAAWNAALMQGAKRATLVDELAQTFPADLRQEFKELLEPLIRRKEELFPHIQRPILSFELTWLAPGKPYLSVLSGLD
jgi:hypothetical protein